MTVHGTLLLGALGAYYKYGDRTEVVEKSLKGTRDASDALLAYLGRALSDSLSPVLSRALEDDPSTESVDRALTSESFLDAVSDFANGEVAEMLQYRTLTYAKTRWSKWARRMSWGVFVLLVQEIAWTFLFVVLVKVFQIPTGLKLSMLAFTASGLTVAHCLVCAGTMMYYHDQITDCREKVL
ncbi:MAG: hypothetical protein P4K83_12410 [Terracidiphilus sp.]|nr:hypothetical protein [Terracidiphilus sp.]